MLDSAFAVPADYTQAIVASEVAYLDTESYAQPRLGCVSPLSELAEVADGKR